MTDTDDNREDRSDTVSVFNGPPPAVHSHKSEREETTLIGKWIAERAKAGVLPHEFGGPGFKLHVSIDIDANRPARISIRDNAAGIAQSEFPRAFRPAAVPPDLTGLSEFGMGMKSAACWFASRWQLYGPRLKSFANLYLS
jgi:hypothetical protein